MPRPSDAALETVNAWPVSECPVTAYRDAIGRLVRRLIEVESFPEDEDFVMPSVANDPENPLKDAEEHVLRADRYAYAGALGIELIKRQLVFDPGQPTEQQSVRLKLDRQSEHPNPYMRFTEDLVANFQAGFEAVRQEQPGKAERLASHHDNLLARDSSRHLTRVPVSSESIRTGNEGPHEVAQISAVIQLLAQNSPYQTAEQRLEIAHSVVDTNIRERAAWGILRFVCNPSMYIPPSFQRPELPHFDLGQASIRHMANRTKAPYRIDFGDQYVTPPESPLIDITCPLKYAKPPGYQLNYLELWLHAAVNMAYDEGLYDPALVPEYKAPAT